MKVIEERFPNWKDLIIHESSPGNRGSSLKLKKNCPSYIASQYYPNKPFGDKIDQFINQDLENQTFKKESFDLVITQDVMEHVFQPERVFSEISRTLKKGGAHIFTVPLVNKHKKSEICAKKLENGEIKYLRTPEYHGNPVDPKGSLVTMHWGYDIVDFIRKSSGMQSEIIYLHDLNLGIWAEYIEVIISYKNK
jgi:SAM-dependent methyltransferase